MIPRGLAYVFNFSCIHSASARWSRTILFVALAVLCWVPHGAAQEKVVGGDFDYPPHSYLTPEGRADGFGIAVLKEIERVTDLNFHYQLSQWDSALVHLKRDQVDLVTGIIYSEQREEDYDFTVPVHTEYYAIFTRKEFRVEELQDLEGLEVALLNGDISVEKLIKPMGLLQEATYVNSLPEAITRVEYGSVDYVIAPYSLGKRTIESQGYEHVVVRGPRLLPSLYCLAVKKGNISLLARLNTGISRLKQNGKLEKLQEEWFIYTRKRERLNRFLGIAGPIAGALLVVLILLYAWLKSLKRQVRLKTNAILQAEKKYRDLFNFNQDGLILFDLQGNIVDANPEACRMYGYKQEEMLSMDGRALVSPPYRHLFDAFLSATQNGGEYVGESVDVRKDGTTFYSSVKGAEIKTSGRLFAVIRDISEVKKAEEELIKARQKAEDAYEYKSNFLSHVSHELRTPVNAIIGYSRLLNHPPMEGKKNRYARNLMSAAETVVSLINDTLDLSKLEAGKVTLDHFPFNLEESLEQIDNILSVLAGQKGLAFEIIKTAETPHRIVGDPFRLRQVLLNLGNNAIKFTRTGKVAIHVVPRVSFENGNGVESVIRFEVHDSGPGISKEQMQYIFEPFHQAGHISSGKIRSTGLGLAITRDLVRLMGGQIHLTSHPGQGSVFSVTLPLRLEKQPDERDVEPEASAVWEQVGSARQEDDDPEEGSLEVLDQARVLVVDDNDFNIEVVGDLLKAANSRVQVVRTGEEAVQAVQCNIYDAVLMDVQMSGMDGNQTTRMIRAMKGLSDLPIIGLSARSTREDREYGLESGMNAYLVKPVVPEQLYQTLIRMIQSKQQDPSSHQTEHQWDFTVMPEAARQDPEAFRRLIRRFMRNYKDAPEKLRNLNEKGDGQKLQALLHSLVNALGVMGAGQLSGQSRNMEKEIKKRGTVDPRQLQVFILSLEAYIRELKKMDVS